MINVNMRTISLTALVLAAGFAWVEPAAAQATRTWVSGVGDDANPCSRTAPCKTFAGAISKTANGGEINCLDPGGFGAVTITKSIAIICDNTEAGVLVSGTNGIIINALATDTIVLSGLDFHGAGTGIEAVRFLAGGHLHVQNSTIRSFNSTNGVGIAFRPSGASRLTVTNTLITNNGSSTGGAGILIQPSGAAGTAQVTLREVVANSNPNFGLRVDLTGNTGPASTLVVDRSQFVGGTFGINILAPPATSTITAMITNSLVAQNSDIGIRIAGLTAVARVGNTTVTGNGTGVFRAGGGVMNTYASNRVDGNTTDGTFTVPALPEK